MQEIRALTSVARYTVCDQNNTTTKSYAFYPKYRLMGCFSIEHCINTPCIGGAYLYKHATSAYVDNSIKVNEGYNGYDKWLHTNTYSVTKINGSCVLILIRLSNF